MPTRKLPCPTCRGPRNCEVVASHVEDYPFLEIKGYFRIVKCMGCDRVFFENEDVWEIKDRPHQFQHVIWPPVVVRSRPAWISDVFKYDESLGTLMGSVYTAFDNNLSVLTAIGTRTVFDRSTHLLGAGPDLNFMQKLDWLHQKGWIGESEKDLLGILTDAGSAAAHRGWEPTFEQLSFVLDSLEAFVHRFVVARPASEHVRAAIPRRHARAATPKPD